MRLNTNKSAHSEVHLTIPEKSASNQDVFRLQYMAEMLKYQESINHKLTESIESLNSLFETTHADWRMYNENISSEIEKQKLDQNQILINLTNFEKMVMETFKKMNKDQEELAQMIGNDENFQQAILAQLSTQDKTSNILLKKLNDLENLSMKLNEQIQENQREMSTKIEVQDVYHQTVMERIDQQEALAHKMDRQLDNLKSVVFERFAHIADKIESQSKHMLKTFSGFIFKPSKNENDKNIKKNTTPL